MQSFSRDLYLSIISYLDYFDQIECTSCCKYLYSSFLLQYIRRITLDLPRAFCENDESTAQPYWNKSFLKLINAVEVQSSYRLKLMTGYELLSEKELLALCHFPKYFTDIECSVKQFCQLIEASFPLVKIQGLTLSHSRCSISEQESDYNNVFTSFITQLFSLHSLRIEMNQLSTIIPYIPSLRHLNVAYNSYTSPIPASYSRQLLSLKLIDCRITDVSMLGVWI